MIIALNIVAAVIMAVGSLFSLGITGIFANFWQARSSCHRAFCSISISPMFRCLGDKFCRNTPDQRWPFNRPFHSLAALFLFRLRQASQRHSKAPRRMAAE